MAAAVFEQESRNASFDMSASMLWPLGEFLTVNIGKL